MEEKDNYRTAKDSLHKLQRRGYLLRVSDVAAGELVRKGIEKRSSTEPFPDFFATLKELGVEVYSLKREEVGRFSELLNFLRSPHREVGGKPAGDPIRPPDSLIVAYSMADRESSGLLTFDTDLLFSKRVAVVVRERIRNRKGFRVTDRVE